jgi:hypothetical protein
MSNPLVAAIVGALFAAQTDPFSITVVTFIAAPWRIIQRATKLSVAIKALALSAFGFLLGGFLYAPTLLASSAKANPTVTWFIVTGSEAVRATAAQHFGSNIVGAMLLAVPAIGFMAWFTKTGQHWPRELKELLAYLIGGAIVLLILSFFT